MDHFVDVISVSEIGESRNIKMTEGSNINRVYAFQIRDSTDCQHSQDLGVGARINSGTRYQSIIMHDMLVWKCGSP